MPLDNLAPELKAEVDALVASKSDEAIKARLAELGVDDHAANVIKKRNEEAKAHRERAEKAETEREALQKRLAEIEDADKVRKADEEKRKLETENEGKTLKTRLAEIEAKFGKDREDLEKSFREELNKRDRELVSEAVRSEAVKRGILDEDLITLFDMAKVEVANGRVDRATVTDLLDEMVASKPILFKKQETDEEREERERQASRDDRGRFIRPDAQPKPKGGKDWSKATQAELDELTEKIRAGRV